MSKRQYSEDDKSAVMAWYEANGKNLRKTARQWELPVATLQHWVYGHYGIGPGVRNKIPKKRKELHDLFEEECRAALEAATEIRDTAPYGTLVTAAAISAEKMRLLRDEPTTINKHEHAIPGEDAILAAAEEIRFRRLVGDAGTGIASGVHEGDLSEV